MSAPNDGGPAFPGGVNEIYTNLDPGEPTNPGMTLRDYLVAHAPVTIADAISACGLEASAPSVDVAVCRVMAYPSKRAAAFAMLAQLRHEYADAMLKAREVKS